MFVNFSGVNIPTMADVRLLIVKQLICKISSHLLISSHEPKRSSPLAHHSRRHPVGKTEPMEREAKTKQVFHQKSLVKGFGFLQARVLVMGFRVHSPSSRESGSRYLCGQHSAANILFFQEYQRKRRAQLRSIHTRECGYC